MSNSYRPIAPITIPNGYAQSVTALSFDPVSDILWTGSETGVVSAHFGSGGPRGPSFPVGGRLSVKKISAGQNNVQALGGSGEGLGSWAKGGANKWYLQPDANIITYSSNNSNAPSSYQAVSLGTLEMLFISPLTGAISRKVPTTSILTHLEASHSMLVSGSSDGFLRVHDPRTGMGRSEGSENFVKAHARSVEGLQTAGNFIFSIGMGERHSHPFPDPLVKIYDLRTMRPLPPIPFSAGPAFIHSMPSRSSSLAIISSTGLVNIVDAMNSSAAHEFYQLDLATTYISSTAVSPNGAYMAFGDTSGTIHFLSQAEDGTPYNGFEGQPLPWADRAAPLPEIEWTRATPLNTIGMPYFDSQLLSAWPKNLQPKPAIYPPPAKIPPQILSSMKYNQNIAYASLPKELRGRRNMTTAEPRKGGARFRSGKALSEEADADAANGGHTDGEIPKMYRRVEIEYSKFGVEDFDFGFYNRTDFSGLETHILNSYTNSIVQIMHYLLPIRKIAKGHITINCPREHCLLCELGFVSRMLEDARGKNCQASNFCKTIGVLAQAKNAIEIVDYGRQGAAVDLNTKIQRFHRFLIDNLREEADFYPHNPSLAGSNAPSHVNPSPITQLLGIDGKTLLTCSICKGVRENAHISHMVDLVYPKRVANEVVKFEEVVQSSLFRQITHKATCPLCKHFSNFITQRSSSTRQLPPILAVNAAVYSDEDFSWWQDGKKSTFLQSVIQLRGQNGEINDPTSATYELRAIVARIAGKGNESHLVSIVKVPEEGNPGASQWVLFNDFMVNTIVEEEALSFPDKWKVPAIVYLERLETKDRLNFEGLSFDLDPTILSMDTSISLNRDPSFIKHEFLRPDELPRPGTLVSIDAEFVSMQQEEAEVRSDGTKKVLRPARLSLARVSVLRGNGPREGIPFIDDHIHTSEIIVDYLTEFSGIKFGDLDPTISKYTLTPLKLVYKKLRLLVDCGCIFIGHGLSKDFRIINIFVPPEQVLDTVDLYFLSARQRRLSLRFLAWYILGEYIQTETHDSIEDARTALRLYNAYHEFEEQGRFDQILEEIYREGRQYGFKPPQMDSLPADTSMGAIVP